MIKTVKCPDCGAEQAIVRDENDMMCCAFCGADVPLPEKTPDEGLPDSCENNSEFIPPEGEPVECDFILKREEVETALISSGKIRSRKGIVWVETALLAVFVIVMTVAVIAGYNGLWGLKSPDRTTWFTLVLAVVLIPVVWVLPLINKRKMIDRAVNGSKISLKIYENLTEISADDADSWQLPFDEGAALICENDMILLVLKNSQILAIPERAFRDCDLEKAKTRLKKLAENA